MCPSCGVNCHTRARLIEHLSERRLRSKHRRELCRDVVLRTSTNVYVDAVTRLEQRDAEQSRDAMRAGHRHVIAGMQPAVATQAHILKRSKPEEHCEPSSVEVVFRPLKKIRLRGKQPPIYQ